MIDQTRVLEDLIREHFLGVWRYLRLLGCTPDLADDLAQETFLSLARSDFEVRTPSQTKAFLRLVAKRRYVDEQRSIARDRALKEAALAERVFEVYGQDGGDSWVTAIGECLSTLPEKTQRIVREAHSGRTHEEVAQDYGLKVSGLRSILQRSRKAIRLCVEGKVKP
ncbi:MAG: RNA polymerase sigma factor [Planctomycetota bacterium]